MKKLIIILIALVALTLAACQSRGTGSSGGGLATKSSQGEVSFDLTPRLADGRLEVAIRANTHSGDLAEIDLQQAVGLEAGGKTYQPVAATKLRGHHAGATVSFPIDHLPDRFVITISGVRTMGEQRLEWP